MANGRLAFTGTLIGNRGVFFETAVDEIERVHWRRLFGRRITIAGKGYTLFFSRRNNAPDVNLAKMGVGELPTGFFLELGEALNDRVMGEGPDLFDLIGRFREDLRGRKAAKLWRLALPDTKSPG